MSREARKRERGEECGGTRFFAKKRFPHRSAKNSQMAGGKDKRFCRSHAQWTCPLSAKLQ